MKKFFVTLFFVLTTLTVVGQRYEPNTKWPYIYDDFISGNIYFDGNKKTSLKLNIHLWGNKLHYLSESQKIQEATDQGVVRVEIGKDAYIFCDHQLMKFLAVEQNNLLVELTKADFDALFSGTGAYGASLNSSASRDLSSLDLGGLDSPEIGRLLQERNDGRTIPLRRLFYFVIDGKLVDASKKSVESTLNENDLKPWNAFVKQNKIKWKDEESLKKVLSFIASTTQNDK